MLVKNGQTAKTVKMGVCSVKMSTRVAPGDDLAGDMMSYTMNF